jgi:hypothetical protein
METIMATNAKAESRSAKAKDERQLDKSLEDSFPASDPSSVTRAPKAQRFVAPPAHAKTRKTPARPKTVKPEIANPKLAKPAHRKPAKHVAGKPKSTARSTSPARPH